MNSWLAIFFNFAFLAPLAAKSADSLALNPIRCAFTISGAPFATLEFGYSDSGEVSPAVKVIHFGNAHSESLTAEPLGDRHLIHAIVSKESPENNLLLEVFLDFSAQLTNPHVPDGFRLMPGTCSRLLNE